jgi:HK97 gp10 family phage protein
MARVTGKQRVSGKLKGLAGEKAIRLVGQALFAGGEILKAEAQHSITEGSVSGRNHVPSLPGESPNADTGVLHTHIETTQPAPLRVEVASNARYSAPLEFGSSRMAARPFMGPAARKSRKQIVALVNRAISKAVKEA